MKIFETPVYIFTKQERTSDFSKYCFEKLGYKNVNLITEGESFKDKYLFFAENAIKEKSEYFIRSDSDCLAFQGINELLEKATSEQYDWLTGVYFDYVMNRFRGGTPQILSKKVLKILHENNNLMPESKKPETDFSIAIKNNVKMGDVKIFTNLHEFEQYPSKVCNSFINRLKRGHAHLYNQKHLNSLPENYRHAISNAISILSQVKQQENMNYLDLGYLDENVRRIEKEDFAKLYEKYENLYKELRSKY